MEREAAPQLARARNPDKDTVGIKWECPAELVLMLDAECCARDGMDRGPLLNEIIGEWAKREAHAYIVKDRVLRGNSALLDSLVGKAKDAAA